MATKDKMLGGRLADIPTGNNGEGEDCGIVVRKGAKPKGEKKPRRGVVTIDPVKMEIVALRIRGTTEYQQNAFSARAQEKMVATMEAGETDKKKRKREPKDFDSCYKEAMHVDAKGRFGIPATAFRAALIRACNICGFAMSLAKVCVFVEADSTNVRTGHPLVLFTNKVKPRRVDFPMRNCNSRYDIRPLPMFPVGWECTLRVRYDATLFTLSDIVNLTIRAGAQVGVGGGRNDAPGMQGKIGVGMGFGEFEVVPGTAKLLATKG